MDNHFKIIVPFYNVEKWIKTTINSVKKQSYDKYDCILIDDVSTDNSSKITKDIIMGDNKFIFIQNQRKKHSLQNIYDAICEHSNDEDIIVILDGDDFLYSKDVLTYLNYVYNSENCLLTYGSYVNLSDRKRGKFAKKVPEHIIKSNQFRNYEWCTSHLRTFKSSLFKKIKKEDLCDEVGSFYTITGDLAIMFPMLEMAREKTKYIDKILYIWNDLNTLNDHKKDNAKQIMIEKTLREGKKYDRFY